MVNLGKRTKRPRGEARDPEKRNQEELDLKEDRTEDPLYEFLGSCLGSFFFLFIIKRGVFFGASKGRSAAALSSAFFREGFSFLEI